jgi:translation initiation factor 2B subunit (eIF-2B alpha/beta/delta family)
MESAAVLAGAPILEHPAATISRTIQTAITETVADLMPILRNANPVLIVARGTAFSAENTARILS